MRTALLLGAALAAQCGKGSAMRAIRSHLARGATGPAMSDRAAATRAQPAARGDAPAAAERTELEGTLPGQVISTLYPAGKRVVYGLLTEDVDPASVPDEAERARRREEAAASLTNIDAQERERRRVIGLLGMVGTGLYASGLLALRAGPAARASVALPLALALGYLESAETGL
mmetsp:Transcript_19625/g.61059  ORF Transcript_19625/g.61059 Transcript_19625/m.61059 type:complete len:174 (-) Transcript_19625:1370-1891(-)